MFERIFKGAFGIFVVIGVTLISGCGWYNREKIREAGEALSRTLAEKQ